MKNKYDKRAKERELVEGQIVLTKIQRLGNKLDDAWDRPYEVIRKISNTNYEIVVPHHRAKPKLFHINNLKTWIQEEARVYRIVVAADDMPDLEDGLKLHGSIATHTQLEQFAKIKQNFADVLNEVPGKIESEEISINTGDSPPIHSIPYRLCPTWWAEVKEEIELLLKGDIIEPGKGPWSSPIVPVRKPDGNIRLCIDFRKLNSVTISDPFCMPLIEDLLDQVGTARSFPR